MLTMMFYSVRQARLKRTVYGSIYMKNLEWSNSQRQKERWWSPEAKGVGNGELVSHGNRLGVWEDEKAVETDNADGCTAR